MDWNVVDRIGKRPMQKLHWPFLHITKGKDMDIKNLTTCADEELKRHFQVLIHLNHNNEFSDRIRIVQAELKRREDG